MNDWKETTLGEIAEEKNGLVDGPFGSNLPASKYTIQGIPVIRGKNLSNNGRRFLDSGFAYVSEETANKLSRSIVRSGDVIFTKKGTLGQTGIVPKESKFEQYLLSSNQMKLSVQKSVAVPEFVYYWMNLPQNRNKLIRESTASGVPKINVKYLKGFPIILPPLSEQKAIASILGALDDKIELNNQMNQTLETMARALYKSWFVDFDPVVAKAADKRPFGMDEETAALFPDKFVDSELGPIPEGWEIQKLDSVVKLIPGRSYISKELQVSKVALVTLKSFQRGGGYRTGGLKPYTGKYSEDQIVKTGDLVVARTDLTQAAEVIGRPALIENCENYPTLVASLDLLIVRPNNPEHLYFYHELLNSSDYINHVLGYANGTTVLHLHKDALPDYRYVTAPDRLVNFFCNQVNQYYSLILTNKNESQTLSQIRDLLLPKLISGEIRIKDAEKVVEEVL